MPRWHASWVSIHRSKVCLWVLGGGIDELSFTYYAAVRSIELHAETEGLHMGVLLVLQLLAATMLAQLVPHLSRTCWGRQMGQMRHGWCFALHQPQQWQLATMLSRLQICSSWRSGLVGCWAQRRLGTHPMGKLLGSRHGLLIDEGTATVEHRSESRTIKRQSQSQKPTYLGKIPILDHFWPIFLKISLKEPTIQYFWGEASMTFWEITVQSCVDVWNEINWVN